MGVERTTNSRTTSKRIDEQQNKTSHIETDRRPNSPHTGDIETTGSGGLGFGVTLAAIAVVAAALVPPSYRCERE